MVIDYFNGCARARRLGIVAQIKIMGEPSLVGIFRSVVRFFSFFVKFHRSINNHQQQYKESQK
jgi:hypothetical protein